MPEKKASRKKAAKKTSSTKKAGTSRKPAKKAAVKKTVRKTVKKAAEKAVKKAATGKTGKKEARKGATKTASATKKTAENEKAEKSRPKASDFVKRPSHTPAVFKPDSKKPIHILFTMEDVREVLKKRAADEKEKASQKKAAKAAKKAAEDKTAADKANTTAKSRHHAASLDDILGLSGGSPGGNPGQQTVPRKHQKYYRLLMELRNEVRNELNLHSNDTLKRSQKEDAGDLSISVDAGTDNFDRDFALSLLSSEQEALNEIEEAIQRIHNGTYGICEVTGEPIKPERLEAVPFTRFSVEGQKEYESNARKRVSRAGAFLNESSGEKISFGDDDSDN